MKKLYLIRHAKSDWGTNTQSDFERPLSERGIRDVKSIGKFLLEKKLRPDKIYASSSQRTTSTIKEISKIIDYDIKKIKFDKNLYDHRGSGVDYYVSYLMDLEDKNKSVFFVGHNYIWSELASYLLGTDIGIIPTCSIVAVSFDIKSWGDIGYSKGKLDFYMYPKKLSK